MKEQFKELRSIVNQHGKEIADIKAMLKWGGIAGTLIFLVAFGTTWFQVRTVINDQVISQARNKADSAAESIRTMEAEIESKLYDLKQELHGDIIIRKRSVLQFDHPKADNTTGRTYAKGEEWAERVYHIRTPVKVRSLEMWRFDLIGYSYGIGQPLYLTWVGYTFSEGPVLRNHSALDNAGTNIQVDQYFGSDGYLYLRFGPLRQYYNSFVLDYQSGSTGSRLDPNGSYAVLLTQNRDARF